MSLRLVAAVVRHEMTGPQKAVLMVLCLRANDHGGDCYPSIPTIVRESSHGKRTVQRAIADLEADGWLFTRMTRERGKVFELNAGRIMGQGCQSGTVKADRKGEGGGVGAAPVPERRERGAAAAPNKSGTSPTKAQRAKPKNTGPLPEGWQPEPFLPGGKAADIIDGWDTDRLETEVEKFRAWHGTRDNRFSSWQQAWATWVLNTRRFAHDRGSRGADRAHGAGRDHAARRGRSDGLESAIDRSLGLGDPAAPAGRAAAGALDGAGDGQPAHLRLVQ